MSNGTVVKLAPEETLDGTTSHAVVAAQLRGEARAQDEDDTTALDAVVHEIENLGLVADRPELRRRYDTAIRTAPAH